MLGRAVAIEELTYADLSLPARLAVGLDCFRRWCAATGLKHREIDALLNDLWAFPFLTGKGDFDDWEANHPLLVHVGLGDPMPASFEQDLRRAEVEPDEFRRLIESLIEIVFGSFFGACDDQQSLGDLQKVIAITGRHRVAAPLPSRYASSLFRDDNGWGAPPSADELQSWRQGEA